MPIDTTNDRELRLRCLELAVGVAQYAGADAETIERASAFFDFVRGDGAKSPEERLRAIAKELEATRVR